VLPKPLAAGIVSLVTLVWLLNFGAQFFVTNYQVDGWVHTIFLSVVGGALAFSRNDNRPPPPTEELGRGEQPPTTIQGIAPPPGPPEPPPGPSPEPPPEPPRPSGGMHRAPFALLPFRGVLT
jgi:hypothetical protein